MSSCPYVDIVSVPVSRRILMSGADVGVAERKISAGSLSGSLFAGNFAASGLSSDIAAASLFWR